MLSDKVLTCRDCRSSFVFTVSEQEFYASKGFTNEPGRCPSCRQARKARQTTGGYSGGYSEGRYDRPRREMHPATCAACGAETMVPFVPRGDKPVYCSRCYESVRGGSYSRR